MSGGTVRGRRPSHAACRSARLALALAIAACLPTAPARLSHCTPSISFVHPRPGDELHMAPERKFTPVDIRYDAAPCINAYTPPQWAVLPPAIAASLRVEYYIGVAENHDHRPARLESPLWSPLTLLLVEPGSYSFNLTLQAKLVANTNDSIALDPSIPTVVELAGATCQFDVLPVLRPEVQAAIAARFDAGRDVYPAAEVPPDVAAAGGPAAAGLGRSAHAQYLWAVEEGQPRLGLGAGSSGRDASAGTPRGPSWSVPLDAALAAGLLTPARSVVIGSTGPKYDGTKGFLIQHESISGRDLLAFSHLDMMHTGTEEGIPDYLMVQALLSRGIDIAFALLVLPRIDFLGGTDYLEGANRLARARGWCDAPPRYRRVLSRVAAALDGADIVWRVHNDVSDDFLAHVTRLTAPRAVRVIDFVGRVDFPCWYGRLDRIPAELGGAAAAEGRALPGSQPSVSTEGLILTSAPAGAGLLLSQAPPSTRVLYDYNSSTVRSGSGALNAPRLPPASNTPSSCLADLAELLAVNEELQHQHAPPSYLYSRLQHEIETAALAPAEERYNLTRAWAGLDTLWTDTTNDPLLAAPGKAGSSGSWAMGTWARLPYDVGVAPSHFTAGVSAVSSLRLQRFVTPGQALSPFPAGQSATLSPAQRAAACARLWYGSANATAGAPSSREPIVVAFVARLSREKGLGPFLKAAAAARAFFSNATASGPHRPLRFVVIGKASSDAYLASVQAFAASLGLSFDGGSGVDWVGFVPPRQLSDWYASSCVSVVVAPYLRPLSETFGLVLTEAMAAGVPVVHFGAGGIADYARHGINSLSPAPSSAALADALVRLISDDGARAAMGAAARDHVLGALGPRTVARVMESQLRAEVAAARLAAPPVVRGSRPHRQTLAAASGIPNRLCGDGGDLAWAPDSPTLLDPTTREPVPEIFGLPLPPRGVGGLAWAATWPELRAGWVAGEGVPSPEAGSGAAPLPLEALVPPRADAGSGAVGSKRRLVLSSQRGTLFGGSSPAVNDASASSTTVPPRLTCAPVTRVPPESHPTPQGPYDEATQADRFRVAVTQVLPPASATSDAPLRFNVTVTAVVPLNWSAWETAAGTLVGTGVREVPEGLPLAHALVPGFADALCRPPVSSNGSAVGHTFTPLEDPTSPRPPTGNEALPPPLDSYFAAACDGASVVARTQYLLGNRLMRFGELCLAWRTSAAAPSGQQLPPSGTIGGADDPGHRCAHLADLPPASLSVPSLHAVLGPAQGGLAGSGLAALELPLLTFTVELPAPPAGVSPAALLGLGDARVPRTVWAAATCTVAA